jgi:protoporphyrinogen oxidase
VSAEVLILGGGLAGLSAAYHLGDADTLVYEAADRPGGLCRSEHTDGFIFDHAVHLIYTDNPEAKAFMCDLLEGNLWSEAREAWVYSQRAFTRYPFQANTYGLPVRVIKECLLGLIEAKYEMNHRGKPKNFEEWIYRTFGAGIAKHFMIPYNRKIWTVEPHRMDIEWIDGRVPQPDIEEVLDGAVEEQRKDFGPNARFYYPRTGGIEALSEALAGKTNRLRLGARVASVNLRKREITLDNGEKHHYEFLISSLPLPRFVEMVEDAPRAVRESARALVYNKIAVVNVGVDREGLSRKHWVYFPEEEFAFHRVSFPMNFSPHMVPEGKSSVSAEVPYRKDDEVHTEGMVDQVVDDLIGAGILSKGDNVVVTGVLVLDPAYVVYDLRHRRNVRTIHAHLLSERVYPCGRFGEWEYLNMDHALMSGRKAALRVSERMGRPVAAA